MDKIGRLTAMAVTGLFLAGLCAAAPDRIIYVDDDATGANDGTSWANAFPFLQDALAAARSVTDVRGTPRPVEIRIAGGIYRPDQGGGTTPGNREAAFNIPTGAVLKGGYVGGPAHRIPDNRDVQYHRTILSGDVKGNDAVGIDVKNLASDPTRSDNSTYVITSSYNSSATVLDGLVITGATRAGLYCIDSSPVVVDCVFIRNSTTTDGGALRQERTGGLALTRCTFTENWARQYGGALYLEEGLTLTDCVFTDNQGGNGGGAIYNLGRPVLTGCTFTRNAAKSGGAIYNPTSMVWAIDCRFTGNSADNGGAVLLGAHASIDRCRFTENQARLKGGALFRLASASDSILNCVFTGNSAQSGGAIHGFAWSTFHNCLFEHNTAETGSIASSDCYGSGFVNCTFFANAADDGTGITLGPCGVRAAPHFTMASCILWESGGISVPPAPQAVTGTITYSLIQGGWPGEGNIDTDPRFAAPGRWDPNGTRDNPSDDVWIPGDYHLKSQAGRWDPADQRWVQDDVTSLCIDAGDPQAAIGLEPFPNGGVVNMGVFGGTAEASKSYFGKPPCLTIIAGDINGDCKVNMDDLEIMMRHWHEGENEPEKPARR